MSWPYNTLNTAHWTDQIKLTLGPGGKKLWMLDYHARRDIDKITDSWSIRLTAVLLQYYHSALSNYINWYHNGGVVIALAVVQVQLQPTSHHQHQSWFVSHHLSTIQSEPVFVFNIHHANVQQGNKVTCLTSKLPWTNTKLKLSPWVCVGCRVGSESDHQTDSLHHPCPYLAHRGGRGTSVYNCT